MFTLLFFASISSINPRWKPQIETLDQLIHRVLSMVSYCTKKPGLFAKFSVENCAPPFKKNIHEEVSLYLVFNIILGVHEVLFNFHFILTVKKSGQDSLNTQYSQDTGCLYIVYFYIYHGTYIRW